MKLKVLWHPDKNYKYKSDTLMAFTNQLIEFGTPEYDEAVSLRYEVLRKPLGLEFTEEQLSKEYEDVHIACFDEMERMAGILILTSIGEDVKMRQVAVRPDVQNRGIGKQMVVYAEHWAKHKGYKKMILNARETASHFYLNLGYKIEGDKLEEVGIPHFFMWKELK